MISESLPGTLEVPRKSQIRESFGPVQRNAMPTAPARAIAMIREACGHFRRPQKPLSEHTEYPKSRSMGLFWNLNQAPVTTVAPVRAGKAQKWDPSEPAAANRTPPWLSLIHI